MPKRAEGNRIPLQIVHQSAEEHQRFARGFPPYPVPNLSLADWRRWEFGSGFHLLLPRDFEPVVGSHPGQYSWTSARGSRFLLTEDDGRGLVTPALGFDSEPPVRLERSSYSISVASSPGTMVLLSGHEPTGATYPSVDERSAAWPRGEFTRVSASGWSRCRVSASFGGCSRYPSRALHSG
jgi:hypothetical protein